MVLCAERERDFCSVSWDERLFAHVMQVDHSCAYVELFCFPNLFLHRLGCFYIRCFHISFPTLLLLHKKVTKCWWRTILHSQKALHHPVACGGIAGALHCVVARQDSQSKAQLSSNPDVSNRNKKKTMLSPFRGLAVCYLSLQCCVISPRYTVTAPVLRESYLLGSQ